MKNHREQESEARLIDFHEVKRLVSLSRSTIFKLERAGQFPARRRVTERKVAWIEGEVQDWIKERSAVPANANLVSHSTATAPQAAALPAMERSTAGSPSVTQAQQEPVRKERNWMNRWDD